MQKLILIGIIFLSNYSIGQMKYEVKNIKILGFKSYENGIVCKGIDLSQNDTIYFISPKDSLKSKRGFEKIKIGAKYFFKIVDMDFINGIPTPVFPNGYTFRFGNVDIKRLYRNGSTITTCQYISINTNGLCIEKKDE